MLSEMTGSLRATNVKRQYYPRDRHHTFHTVHHEQSILSEVNIQCQINSHLPVTILSVTMEHCIITSNDDDQVSVMTPCRKKSCNDAGYRRILRVNIEHRTLHAEYVH